MKAIWMHGMGGRPNQEKINLLEGYGFEMHALHIDYLQEAKTFEILHNYCIEQKIEFLIGSSHGGFLGFWLSEELGIPCLLLNPAVSLRAKNKSKPQAVSRLESPLCIVALGGLDDKVDHQRTLLFMEKDRREGKEIITRVFENEGHGFTIDTFDEIVKWTLTIIQK